MIEEKPGLDVFLAVQSAIALILVLTLCVMLLSGAVIPDLLIGIAGIVVGQYFGQRQAASGLRQSAIAVQAVAKALSA